jgi:hypothetical protein
MARAALIGRRSKALRLGIGETGMASADMEYQRVSDYPGVSVGGTMEMEATCTGCDLVDSGGSASNNLLYSIHDPALESKSGRGSMFEPDKFRPQFDWNSYSRSGPLVNKKDTMTERRSAKTIEELDVHFGYMMSELQSMRKDISEMSRLLATKEELNREIATLRAEVQNQAPKTIWKKGTDVAVGISAVAAAFWVVISVLRSLRVL